MLDSQQKRKVNRILYHRATLIILGLVTVFMLRSVWVVYHKKIESQDLKEISVKHKQDLEQREKDLQNQIDRLNTASGMEAEIRSKFNVAKGSENVVVIVDDGANATETATSTKNIWQKFLDLFK